MTYVRSHRKKFTSRLWRQWHAARVEDARTTHLRAGIGEMRRLLEQAYAQSR